MTSSSNQRDNQQPRRRSMAILLVVSCVVITIAAGIGLGLFISNRQSSRPLQSQPQYQWNEVHGLRETFKAITGTNDSFRVAVSPDGHTIAVGGQQTIRIWDSKRKEVVAVMGDDLLQRIDALTFNSDGRLLAVTGWGSVVLFDVARHTRLTSFTSQDCLGGVAFHPTEPLLASSSCGKILLKKWVSPSLVDVKILNSGSSEETYQGPYHVSFSPDGRTLAASDHDGGHVNLWNVGSWAKRTTLNAHVKIWNTAFNPDGRLLAASAGDMDRVLVWDVEKHVVVSTLQGLGPGTIWPIAFSPDGQVLLTGGNKWLMVWDVNKRVWLTKQRTSRYPWELSFSSDGQQLFVSDGDLTIWKGIA